MSALLVVQASSLPKEKKQDSLMQPRWLHHKLHLVLALLIALPGWLLAADDTVGAADKTGQRVNHAGRNLPAPPEIKQPVLFNTPEADALLAAMQIFPKDNAWNEDISRLPVHRDSDKMIAQIGKDKHVHFNRDMGFVLVPPTQPKLAVKLTAYGDESDPGPYPIPDCTPIESWPLEGGKLEDLQRRQEKGDRHAIVVDPRNNKLYEFYQLRKTDAGWEASCEATFDLSSNKLRPKGWTSSDAAGLPIFPAIVRYDEVERGLVEHALRVTVTHTRHEFIYPATHYAGKGNDPAVPAMGQRLRLKAGADLAGLPKHALAVAKALQQYGMFVADNGSDWFISSAPDDRIKGLETLKRFKGSDFEVVQTTGELEGPRKK